MSGISIFLSVLYILFCVIMIFLILSQEGKQQGLGTLAGGSADSYWSKIKGHTKEGILPKLTMIFASLFLLLSVIIAMNIFG